MSASNMMITLQNYINHVSIDFLNQFAYIFNIRKYLALSLIKVFGFFEWICE